MKLLFRLPGMLALMVAAVPHPAVANTTGPFTYSFANLTTGAGDLQRVYSTFSFPRFDTSLGSLESVDLSFNFSGAVVGSATGVSPSSSINGTISHNVFFLFEDISDHVFIAEPTLRLTSNIPGGAVSFGPEFQSTSVSFTVRSGDFRFPAWNNGPGDISARLGVFFSNTAPGFNDRLNFFPGTDGGVYVGSFSIAYNYVPVPEPSCLSLGAASALLVALRKGVRKMSVN